MKTQGPIAKRSLPLLGQCAFVRLALGHESQAVVAMNYRHSIESLRPFVSLGQEDWMHPGEGGVF
ncbi:hypothetical protein OOT46_21510 [Aquabacterium sp. A7-Y]|uniref:hypothetical protein n=1 Tax=Aquabacterium sp. A7-Y TaxID=1349605 RepID=UPI00223D99BB|nr:hypothetical protein [Aquabacterium sp. A7-Y]MCW7540415.1 hypothetical protein [Aquabacterium sp. A7-Y]